MYQRFITVLSYKNSSLLSFLLTLTFLLDFSKLDCSRVFSHSGWFYLKTWTYSFTGLCIRARDHHRGLNSLSVSDDRKCWNGMLCLSAF